MTAPATANRPLTAELPKTEGNGAWIQVPVAARTLKVTKGRIYHLIDQNRVRTQKFHGLTYVNAADIEDYKAMRTQIANFRKVGWRA